VVLLPVIAALRGGKWTAFLALVLMLFVPGAFIPLIAAGAASSLPAPIIPFHLLEILADSIVYGFALSRILGKPGKLPRPL